MEYPQASLNLAAFIPDTLAGGHADAWVTCQYTCPTKDALPGFSAITHVLTTTGRGMRGVAHVGRRLQL